MTLLSAVKRLPHFLYYEIKKDQSFVDGDCFERFVRKYLFQKLDFKLLEMTHDYSVNNRDYVYSSLKPDFRFYDQNLKRDFYVECKWRSGFNSDYKIEWCNEDQLQRYKHLNLTTPVFVIIGVGGVPSSPELIFLLPLSKVNYTGLFEYYLRKFDVSNLQYINSKQIWHLL